MEESKGETMANPPPVKKLKQARLPFKVITPKAVQQAEPSVPTTPPSNKKRKLSDGAPGPIKASKTPRNDENRSKTWKNSPKLGDAENEVSSSSEADPVQKPAEVTHVDKTKRTGLLDKFVRKPQQLEISTTNIPDSSNLIDLTDSNDSVLVCDKASMETENSVAFNELEKNNVQESELEKNSLSDRALFSYKNDADIVLADSDSGDRSAICCDSTDEKYSSEKCNDENLKENLSSRKETAEVNVKSLGEIRKSSEPINNSLGKGEQSHIEGESKADEKQLPDKTNSSEKDVNEAKTNEHNTSIDSLVSQNDSVVSEISLDEIDSSEMMSPSSNHTVSPDSNNKSKKQAKREIKKQEKLEKKEQMRQEKQREKEEKEKQRKEEKERKDKEKEEAKRKKEQERKDKLEQKEKEKQEKLKQKEEEKKKKEEEKLKKIEEKKKELEEKQKQKEEREKLKADEQKSKISEKQVSMFSNFFTKKEKEIATKEEDGGNFIQFQVQSDMRLAPVMRRTSDPRTKEYLDCCLEQQDTAELYLQDIKKKDYKCGKTGKTWPSYDSDLMIVEVEGKPDMKCMKAKYFGFHENYRPAYRGTWTKKSKKIVPRNPFAKDSDLLDYEVDSDEEWEEEEPGESLSDSCGEEEEGEADDDEEDGFFVPHGYLSEGEGAEDDEEDATPDRLKARQLAKAKAFETDMKKKTELLKPVCTGCCWWAYDQESSSGLDILNQFKAMGLVPLPIDLSVTRGCEVGDKQKKNEEKKKLQPQNVPEEAIPDLIRLVHGNRWSVQKLIREFREFWRLKASGVDPVAHTANIHNQSQEIGEDDEADTSQNDTITDEVKYSMSKRQLDKMIKEIAVYERRPDYHKSCWYVGDAVLERYGIKDLTVPTTWVWVTKDPNTASRVSTPSLTGAAVERSPAPSQTSGQKAEGSIIKFTKPGISPKIPVVSPKPIKPLPSASSTPITQGKCIALTPLSHVKLNSSETPKKDAKQKLITPLSLFKTDGPCVNGELSTTEVAITAFQPPPPKVDKNQRTLLTMFSPSLKANSIKAKETADCIKKKPNEDTSESGCKAMESGSKMKPVLGSAECPMEID